MQTLTQQVLADATGTPEARRWSQKNYYTWEIGQPWIKCSLAWCSAAHCCAGHGIYVLPVESRFGTRAPSAIKMVEGLANQRGETIVSHGAAAANALGLTTQVPMRAVYLTSGRSRRLTLGAQMLEFRHAPTWQLIFPGRVAGEVVRALAWLGPENAGDAIRTLRARLPASALNEVASARARLPTWMAKEISALVSHG